MTNQMRLSIRPPGGNAFCQYSKSPSFAELWGEMNNTYRIRNTTSEMDPIAKSFNMVARCLSAIAATSNVVMEAAETKMLGYEKRTAVETIRAYKVKLSVVAVLLSLSVIHKISTENNKSDA